MLFQPVNTQINKDRRVRINPPEADKPSKYRRVNIMRKIPTSINAQFDALLNKSKIPKRYQNHYLKCLRYYLDFCHGE